MYAPYTNEIESKLSELTLAEKIQLCHASTKFSVKGISRAAVPDMIMSDGPHGVRREISKDSWDPVDTEEDYSTYLPTGTAVAATFNPEMGERHGTVLGAEARERGKDIILGPGFNIVRSPLCGRNFEYYSEDPYHIVALVGGAVKAIQAQGTAACAKHFACNSQELNRNGVNALPSERALREIYLPGFKAAVDAGVLTIMGAYNFFRGQWCCQNDTLLNEILKKEWGFEGSVMSDWNGVHKNSYEPAYNGMDIEMGTEKPYEDYYLARGFREAIENGEIDEEILNDKVRRYLYVMYSIGAMGEKSATRPQGERNTPKHQQECLAIAEEAMVLLKNEGQTLPLSRNIKKLLVVGNNATTQHHAGGASSAVKALYEITPLEGVQKFLGDEVEIEYCPDPSPGAGFAIPTTVLSPADLGAGVNGWKGELFNSRHHNHPDQVIQHFAVNEIDYAWEKELPAELLAQHDWKVHFTTTLTAPEDGIYTFILTGCHNAGMTLNGAELIIRYEEDTDPEVTSIKVDLKQGVAYKLMVHIAPCFINLSKQVALTWISPLDASTTSLGDLEAKAQSADAVIYVGGLSHQLDTEGKDKPNMALPGMQDDVIPALAKANKNFVALMTGGSPYTMPWVDEVPAILHMWYAGMEAGTAAAKILFGEVNPSGKLPFTFPVNLQDSPGHYLNDYDKDVCYYKEDIYVGYRWFDQRKIEPLFCFGHGLSYSSFDYSELSISTSADSPATVSFKLTNTGKVAGAEVAQLYLHDCEASVGRPPQELKRFQKVWLEPGASETITFTLNEEDLSFFHPTRREWIAEKGEFEVRINSSSRDNRLNGTFTF
ncbi:glycoside hydrolase family 3 C-terminal domain-containing protein [Kiritimatiellota bacterium B12222]|nr:glycoside hydrolase family 3 C-terminal domain-containing protein [Kiritimatiellota bacterium B12222]